MSVSEYLLCLILFSNILVSAIHSTVRVIVDIIKHIDITKLPCLQNIRCWPFQRCYMIRVYTAPNLFD